MLFCKVLTSLWAAIWPLSGNIFVANSHPKLSPTALNAATSEFQIAPAIANKAAELGVATMSIWSPGAAEGCWSVPISTWGMPVSVPTVQLTA